MKDAKNKGKAVSFDTFKIRKRKQTVYHVLNKEGKRLRDSSNKRQNYFISDISDKRLCMDSSDNVESSLSLLET